MKRFRKVENHYFMRLWGLKVLTLYLPLDLNLLPNSRWAIIRMQHDFWR